GGRPVLTRARNTHPRAAGRTFAILTRMTAVDLARRIAGGTLESNYHSGEVTARRGSSFSRTRFGPSAIGACRGKSAPRDASILGRRAPATRRRKSAAE